ncbi:MAG: exodeoxyribonuclease VII large subunit [Clostridia bacterium]|nr:exodeoxyribonuclease VII large subunit [Clostridia bacterium]
MPGETVFTVTRLNEYANRVLQNDPRLRNIKVSGEISGFKRHSSGHLYFNLKDEGAVVSCVMFRSAAAKLAFEPREGVTVVVRGSVSIYAKDGRYQLYAEAMRAEGDGELYRRFLMLKEKLEAEGVFENARALPRLPRVIGVATSGSGAALQDIINVTRRRFPNMNVLLAPCQVQGPSAPAEIAAAVRALGLFPEVDVIITGRGGGSYEDLSCFNDERVARAIFSSRVPVVSAVGHETDFTIADFAADLRAPTPSAAAELCCPRLEDLLNETESNAAFILHTAQAALAESARSLEMLTGSAAMANPGHAVEIRQERLRALVRSADSAARAAVVNAGEKLSSQFSKLGSLSPAAVMERGYAIVSDPQGKPLPRADELVPGESIRLVMKGGSAKAAVESIELNGES